MGVVLKNNAVGYLQSAITASDTGIVLTVGTGANFPSLAAGEYFYATISIGSVPVEIVKVTARSGDTLTVVRGQEGTSASNFSAGSAVELRVTAQSIVDSVAQLPKDASTVSYVPSGTGAVTTNVQAKLRQLVSVKDFGAVGNGVANDTVAIQAAIDAVYNAGGGTLFFPSGTYLVTSIVRNWANPITVNLQGEGKRSTVIKKFDASTTPLFDLSGIASMLEPYSEISEMTLNANNVGANGIRATNFGRWVLRNVFITGCNRGLYCRGGLVFDVYDCTFQANQYGYYCEKSANNVFSNLVSFYGGQFSGNTTWGLYITQASGVHIVGTDISFNGTSGDVNTGGIYYDATMDDEIGYAIASIKNAWFEGNFGNGIKTGAVGGLHFSMRDTTLAGNFNPVTIGAIAMSEIINCFAGSTTDTIVVGAGRSIIENCIFYALNDNSTYYHHLNVVGNAYNHINQTNARRDVICGTERFVQGSAADLTAGTPEDFVNFLFGTGQQQFWCQNVKNLSLGPAAIGFYGTSPQTKQTITGSRGGNAALASLLTGLAALGLITDSTTA